MKLNPIQATLELSEAARAILEPLMEPRWYLYPFGKHKSQNVMMDLVHVPNRFHRWVHRVVFGFVYEKVEGVKVVGKDEA